MYPLQFSHKLRPRQFARLRGTPPALDFSMPALRSTSLFVLMFLLSASAIAEIPTGVDPLFQSHEVIKIRIEAPLYTLMRERSDEEELEGQLTFAGDNGEEISLNIQLRARGNYRRQVRTCRFAPVRLNFKTSEVKDTLFHKQDKLKLVTHCRDGSANYEQLAVKEYVTYRMFNLLTERSYRVRLLHITWVDTEGKRKEREHYGFAIEHKDRFAKRTDLPVIDIERNSVDALDPAFTNLTSMFQFFVGNTDYSPIAGARGETCCHNTHLYGDVGGPVYPVPYDFDMSGLIKAPYATPNPAFRITDVRQRLYRGRCAFNSHIPDSVQQFQQQRAAILSLINDQPQLTNSSRTRMRRYTEQFFGVIGNPRTVDNMLVKACR